jgi:hypothetical protein
MFDAGEGPSEHYYVLSAGDLIEEKKSLVKI